MKNEPKFKVGDTLINQLNEIFVVDYISPGEDGRIWYYYPEQCARSIATVEDCCRKASKLELALK
jgi:hypothetical protein